MDYANDYLLLCGIWSEDFVKSEGFFDSWWQDISISGEFKTTLYTIIPATPAEHTDVTS